MAKNVVERTPEYVQELEAVVRALADYSGGTNEGVPGFVFMIGGWANGLLENPEWQPLPEANQRQLEESFAETTNQHDWRVYPS